MSLGAINGFSVRAVMPRSVALLADDAEVAELEAAAVADEDVERREVAVQQSARDAACRARARMPAISRRAARSAKRLPRAGQERAQVAVARVLEARQ